MMVDSLEEETAAPCSIVAWRIPWTEEPGGYSPRAANSWTQVSDRAQAASVVGGIIQNDRFISLFNLTYLDRVVT